MTPSSSSRGGENELPTKKRKRIRPTLVDVAVAHAREIAGKAGFDLVREGGDSVVEYVTRLLMQKL